MNNVTLIGRITRDPETRTSQGENATTVLRFNLAVNKDGKKDEADFIPCVCFGKTAEVISQYLKKGDKLAVMGRIQSGNYTDKDGKKKYTLDVIVHRVEFLNSVKKDGTAKPEDAAPTEDGFLQVDESVEMPFV